MYIRPVTRSITCLAPSSELCKSVCQSCWIDLYVPGLQACRSQTRLCARGIACQHLSGWSSAVTDGCLPLLLIND